MGPEVVAVVKGVFLFIRSGRGIFPGRRTVPRESRRAIETALKAHRTQGRKAVGKDIRFLKAAEYLQFCPGSIKEV
jgi:hypothetical protein